jgi:hypothetical protein
MNWVRIRALLSQCTVQNGTDSVPLLVPGAYSEVLREMNGVEGFVASEQYLVLWPAESLEELNAAYGVTAALPSIVLIGSDGGDTGYGVTSNGEYLSVPLVGMAQDEVRVLGHCFEEFVENIAGA